MPSYGWIYLSVNYSMHIGSTVELVSTSRSARVQCTLSLGQVEKADTVGRGHGRRCGHGHGHEPKLIFQPFAV